MPLSVLPALGVVLAVMLIAFTVSAAIGMAMGRLSRDEPPDTPVGEPAALGRRAQG